MIHDHNLVGEGVGLVLVVGDLNKGHAKLALELAQLASSFDPQAFIQSTEGLVEHEHLGPGNQGAG